MAGRSILYAAALLAFAGCAADALGPSLGAGGAAGSAPVSNGGQVAMGAAGMPIAGAGGTTSNNLAGAGGTTASSGAGAGGASGASDHAAPLFGVTVDDIGPLANVVDALGAFARKPTARVVFDLVEPPSYYADALTQIHGVAGVMGELVDSSDVAKITADEYTARASDYLAAVGDNVDIWEVGNEVNGDPWLGATADVVAKITGAYGVIKAAGKPTALTLYYNQGCFEQADHEMFTWAGANVPADMKQGLDYVFISFYEDDCNGISPDWPAVYAQLGDMFPNSKIGFGECGTQNAANKAAYVKHYYDDVIVKHPRYVLGGFWWYFVNDMTPSSTPLWSTLNAAFTASPY